MFSSSCILLSSTDMVLCIQRHWDKNGSINFIILFKEAINNAAAVWGIKCLRYEIRKWLKFHFSPLHIFTWSSAILERVSLQIVFVVVVVLNSGDIQLPKTVVEAMQMQVSSFESVSYNNMLYIGRTHLVRILPQVHQFKIQKCDTWATNGHSSQALQYILNH